MEVILAWTLAELISPLAELISPLAELISPLAELIPALLLGARNIGFLIKTLIKRGAFGSPAGREPAGSRKYRISNKISV